MPAIVHGGPSQHFLLTLLANGDVWKGPRRRRPEQQFPHCRELDGAKSGILLVAHVCETAAETLWPPAVRVSTAGLCAGAAAGDDGRLKEMMAMIRILAPMTM